MSTTNGNRRAPTVEQLREQTQVARAHARLARARHEQQLWESAGMSAFGLGWDRLDPYGFRRDDLGGIWLPLSQGVSAKQGGANRPFVQSDSDLDAMRALAGWLTTRNDLAIGALGLLTDFTIKKGFDFDARAAEGYEEDGRALSLARQVDRVIGRHSDVNKLPSRQRSAFRRAVRDGDAIIRHFAQADGTTIVRPVRAEQVRDPGNAGPHASFGVECDPDDVETPLYYHVTYDGTSYERVPADEISFIKRNVDEEVKRGLSDFYSGGESLDEVSKLLRGMRRGATLLSKIAWIEEYANTTTAQLQAHSAGLRDLNVPQIDHPVTGRPVSHQYMDDGTVVRTKDNKKYQPPPLANNVGNFVEAVQACLRAAGVRWRMAEYMSSGFMGNVAELSILAAGSSFVNFIECEQDEWGLYFLRWLWIAVRNACRGGLIDATIEEVEALVDIHFTPPPVAVTNEMEQANIDWGDMDRGVMSVPSRRSRRKLDDAKERQGIAEEPPVAPAAPVRESTDQQRGQPDNAGQFGPGGGGGGAGKDAGHEKARAEHGERQSKRDATRQALQKKRDALAGASTAERIPGNTPADAALTSSSQALSQAATGGATAEEFSKQTADHASKVAGNFSSAADSLAADVKAAGAADRKAARVEAVAAKGKAAVARAGEKLQKAAEKVAKLKAAKDALGALGERPESPDLDAVSRELTGKDYGSAEQTDEEQAAVDREHTKREKEADRAGEKWDKAEEKHSALQDKIDDASGAFEEAKDALDEEYTEQGQKLSDAVDDATEGLGEDHDAEEEAIDKEEGDDPEPEAPEEEDD